MTLKRALGIAYHKYFIHYFNNYLIKKNYLENIDLGGKIVLDLGSGNGNISKMLSREAKFVIGLEIDKDSIKFASAQYGGRNIFYVNASGTFIPIKNGSIDFVFCSEVIEHVKDDKKLVSEICRVMSNQGLCLITTPDRDLHKKISGYFMSEKKYLKKLKHERLGYTKNSLTRLMENNGLKIIKVGSPSGKVGLISSILMSKFRHPTNYLVSPLILFLFILISCMGLYSSTSTSIYVIAKK